HARRADADKISGLFSAQSLSRACPDSAVRAGVHNRNKAARQTAVSAKDSETIAVVSRQATVSTDPEIAFGILVHAADLALRNAVAGIVTMHVKLCRSGGQAGNQQQQRQPGGPRSRSII